MSLDGWVETADRVMERQPFMMFFFLVFVFVAAICVMPLVPAIFIDYNLIAKEKEEQRRSLEAEEAQRQKQTRVLNRLFTAADADESGAVSPIEVSHALDNEKVVGELVLSGLISAGDLSD